MPPNFRRDLFQYQRFESAGLRSLGSIARRLDAPGRYVGRVMQDGVPIDRFEVDVAEGHELQQASVDLGGRSSCATKHHRLQPKGVLLGSVSDARRGLSFELSLDGQGIFDSRLLDADSAFIVTPLLPGRYRLSAASSTALAWIEVSEAALNFAGGARRQTAFTFDGQSFEPTHAAIDPGDVLVVQAQHPGSAFTLESMRPQTRSATGR
jgi:hypothetical protein